MATERLPKAYVLQPSATEPASTGSREATSARAFKPMATPGPDSLTVAPWPSTTLPPPVATVSAPMAMALLPAAEAAAPVAFTCTYLSPVLPVARFSTVCDSAAMSWALPATWAAVSASWPPVTASLLPWLTSPGRSPVTSVDGSVARLLLLSS
ncbi:hypothetical protein D3C85_1377250 [compost metagenome]